MMYEKHAIIDAGRTIPALYEITRGAVVITPNGRQSFRIDRGRPDYQTARRAALASTWTGDGWRILFDEDLQRVRILFDGRPTKGQRAAVTAAGFRWSDAAGSWSRKLSTKARRAALELAAAFSA